MKDNRRVIISGWLFIVIMLLLVLRLFFIQLINGRHYASQALPQQTLSILMEEKHGNILDRNGIPFTRANEVLELIILPKIMDLDYIAYDAVYKLTGKTRECFTDSSKAFYKEIIKNTDVSLINKIEQGAFPGIILHKVNIRYDESSIARHIIGYLRKSDGVAMSGIEKVYEQFLRPGLTSLVTAISDAKDQIIPSLGYKIVEPEAAWYDVKLTLDYDVQTIVEKVLDSYPERYHGGLVVDVLSGDILALASRPQYKQHEPYSCGNINGEASFLAIPMHQYPLGSVFKIVVAAAALESNRYNESTRFTCNGGIQVGSNFFPCHTSIGGLGDITLRQAFAHSCNDTFIKIAMELGGDVIIDTAKRFGMGQSIEIELDNAKGVLMTKENYTGPGIANLAIGQGETLVTPLQIADLMLTILNHGQRMQLSLTKGLVNQNGVLVSSNKSNSLGMAIPPDIADSLLSWMGDVVESGTAIAAKDWEIGGAGGKTGTPQVYGDPHSKEYGWFAGFFPQKHPRYIIVIMSREKGGASEVAVPIFHEIAREIWTLENQLVNIVPIN